MTDNDEPRVDFIVISGDATTDEQIDGLTDVIRHSLRTQFAGRLITITIEERVIPEGHPENGTSYC